MEQRMNADEVVIRQKIEQHLKSYKESLEKRRALGLRRKYIKKTTPPPKHIVENEKSGPQVPIVVKGDVDGSLEAILDVLSTYDSKQCRLDIIHYGVGAVTESDVNLAEPFKGVFYGSVDRFMDYAYGLFWVIHSFCRNYLWIQRKSSRRRKKIGETERGRDQVAQHHLPAGGGFKGTLDCATALGGDGGSTRWRKMKHLFFRFICSSLTGSKKVWEFWWCMTDLLEGRVLTVENMICSFQAKPAFFRALWWKKAGTKFLWQDVVW